MREPGNVWNRRDGRPNGLASGRHRNLRGVFALGALFWGVIVAGGTVPPTMLGWDRQQQMVGTSMGIFHPVSGDRTARIRVGRISGAYGKQGVLRVAWRHEAIFDDLELEISDSSDWPRAAAEVGQAMQHLARTNLIRVRRLVLRQLDGPRLTILAEEGVLSRRGDLELRNAVVRAADGAETRRAELVLPLARATSDLTPLVSPAAGSPR